MEILAPAGGPEQLTAAVRAGADAVYLGLEQFSARGAATNFSTEQLQEAVAYCHERRVKVHVALNTLVKDTELASVHAALQMICACGVDAVIVQDLAVAALVRECAPALPMHASTQMTVHNLSGVRALEKLGFSRVVLARELTLEEIEHIAKHTDLEVEVFIHGALCMSSSGMCYLSSLLGQRSGNRGLCAQPCRLNFQCAGREHALSLKDLSAIPHMTALAAAGVDSIKIEGRMKRPEYVAAAVDACRAAREGRTPDMAKLQAVFSRSGFTDGYLTGHRTLDMFGIRRKEDVTAAAGVLDEMAQLYRTETPTLPVDMSLDLTKGELTAACDGYAVTVPSDTLPEPARTAPTDESRARAAMAKMGGTPYYLRRFTFTNTDLVLSASALNALRRKALEAIAAHRRQITPIPCVPFSENIGIIPKTRKPQLRLRFEKAEQITGSEYAEKIILPLAQWEKNPELIGFFAGQAVAELPALCYDEDRLKDRLLALKEKGLCEVQIDNLGLLAMAKELGFTVHGGVGLNILNTKALEEYQSLGLSDATISFELSRQRIRALGGDLSRGAVMYGRLPLMRFRACPKNDCAHCDGTAKLTDRMDIDFPLLCTEKQYQTLYNSRPLWAVDKGDFHIDFMTLYFTDESDPQPIIEDCLDCLPAPVEHTNGLYLKEVM